MRLRFPKSPAATRLCLEHGTDESATDCLRVEERGVTFESPWQFEPLAELMLCLAWRHPRRGAQRTPVSGVVVDSRKVDRGRYETVVLFPDLPPAQRAGIRAFARHTR
jgi:hypothetical protein